MRRAMMDFYHLRLYSLPCSSYYHIHLWLWEQPLLPIPSSHTHINVTFHLWNHYWVSPPFPSLLSNFYPESPHSSQLTHTKIMGISDDVVVSTASDAQTPLLQVNTVNGVVDYKGQPAVRSNSGNWRSAWFIIGTTESDRFIFVSSQLMFQLGSSATEFV